MIKKILIIALLFLGLGINAQKAKYVFLFIGDGMGVNQVYTTELFLAAEKGEVKSTQLLFNTFPVSSSMTTYSANTYVTCSSASGTALSTGMKTKNGILCKSPDLKEDYETFSVKAKRLGYKVGILSSVAIDHATPASFYAHQDKRNMYYEISMELPNYDIDYFGGGGFHFSRGRDGKQPDAYRNAMQKGYTVVNNNLTLNKLKKGSEKVFAINPVLYPLGEFYWEIDKKEGAWSLADFTKKGIELLEGDDGFFMMVEGGKIDWACHANDAATMVHEVLGFNESIEVAYEFYKEHPDETLIIVTADHETGSLFAGIDYEMKPELLRNQKISGQEFGRLMKDLKNKEKSVDFQYVLDLVQDNFGLGDVALDLEYTKQDSIDLNAAFQYEFKSNESVDPDADYLEEKEQASVAETAIKILNAKAGYGWGSTGHSSMPVGVRVIGAGQENFTDNFDNTDMPELMLKSMGALAPISNPYANPVND